MPTAISLVLTNWGPGTDNVNLNSNGICLVEIMKIQDCKNVLVLFLMRLNELTTRSDCCQLLSVVLLYLYMRRIPRALSCRAYLSVWREERAFCVECFSSVRSPLPLHCTFHCLSVWPVPVLSVAWGLMARWFGFASHRCSLHLGDGCQ